MVVLKLSVEFSSLKFLGVFCGSDGLKTFVKCYLNSDTHCNSISISISTSISCQKSQFQVNLS